MSSWVNDAAAVQNHNGAAFNHMGDPRAVSMFDPAAFMPNSTIDPAQFQNQPMQQRMQNGAMRNGSPAFNNPVYQTTPVVPSKRSRTREDSMGESPRMAAGMPPVSRSQTPQQGGYQGFMPGAQPPQQPNQFSHLQHNGSANASPSPIMGNQLRPGAVPQRMSTASPHPFSPAAQQFPPQASPPHSDHGGRTDTPHHPYMPNQAYAPGFNPNFTSPTLRGAVPPQGGMSNPQMMNQMQQPPQMFHQGSPLLQQQPQAPQPPPQQQQQGRQPPPNMNPEQQRMMYQMRLQQQLQQTNLMAAQRSQNMAQNMNPLAKAGGPPVNGQYPHGSRPPQATGRPTNPEQFMKHLTAFAQSRGLQLDVNPTIGDRQINIVMLYMAVTKYGGYKRVSQGNLWPQIAQALQFSPVQYQNAASQLQGHYEHNLMAFEEAFMAQQAQQRQKAVLQQNGAPMPNAPPQMSPTKPMHPAAQLQSPQYMPQPQQSHMIPPQHMVPPQQGHMTPVKQMSQNHQPRVSEFATPPMATAANAQGNVRSNSRSVDASMQNGGFAPTTPGSAGKPIKSETTAVATSRAPAPFELPAVYDPKIRTVDTWGGLGGLVAGFSDSLSSLCADVVHYKPNVPSVIDLGVIDIHALTMSLQSGIHSEIRLALDTLATLSVEPRLQLDLKACDDLLESLIDCAEAQVETLAESAAEVSDVMLISSYEDVLRGSRLEHEGLQDVVEFGTAEYELDHAVDRLVCITTIIRNLSFVEANHSLLADEQVIKFLCTVIRYLGTRNMLLRTHNNTLDLMKDIITFLSNLAQAIEIPGREQALCLLHFLLAFAPCPPPCNAASDVVVFALYDASVHRYLPPAVDTLAKLLARDEPNRTYYKGIFSSEMLSIPPYDLLTKSFGLAISPVPNRRDDGRAGLMQVVEARKPQLMQGMLAAEILTSLLPSSESSLARAWLMSEDGFAPSLLQLITVLSSATTTPVAQRGIPAARGADEDALLHITLCGITVLRRLSEKARSSEDPDQIVPMDGMLTQQNLLGALLLRSPNQPRPEIIKQLCAYAGLEK